MEIRVDYSCNASSVTQHRQPPTINYFTPKPIQSHTFVCASPAHAHTRRRCGPSTRPRAASA
eukprot:2814847-Prymnesium_polylepis.1